MGLWLAVLLAFEDELGTQPITDGRAILLEKEPLPPVSRNVLFFRVPYLRC
jgi:hypothetical protein